MDNLGLWEWNSAIARIHDVLEVETRKRVGRQASTTLAILDAQSAKGALKGAFARPLGRACLWASRRAGPRDAGKKVVGRKHHLLVDTQGRLLNADMRATDIQDRDGAKTLVRQARRRFPLVERILADGGYAGAKMQALAPYSDDGAATLSTRAGSFRMDTHLARAAEIIWPTSCKQKKLIEALGGMVWQNGGAYIHT